MSYLRHFIQVGLLVSTCIMSLRDKSITDMEVAFNVYIGKTEVEMISMFVDELSREAVKCPEGHRGRTEVDISDISVFVVYIALK